MSVKSFCSRCKEYHRDYPDIVHGILSRHTNDGSMEKELEYVKRAHEHYIRETTLEIKALEDKNRALQDLINLRIGKT